MTAITKSDFNSATVPAVSPLYSYTLEIDTTPTGESRTWKKLCAGWDNIAEALNEQIQQYFFLCGHGFASNYVTGMAPAITVTGRRVIGDDAQDYIFGKKYAPMSDRNTNLRLSRTDGSGTTALVSAHVTLANIQEISGAANDASAVSVEIRFNGEPYVGDAWGTRYTVTQTLTGCASSFTDPDIAGGSTFTAYLTADSGKTLGTPTVTMGGSTVSTAWNADQGAVTIANVTGNIVVTATAS